MALTPEDVVNKRFAATKFREGYDQDEVDDFLDEVVVELRRLNKENENLNQSIAEGGAVAAPVAAAVVEAPAAGPAVVDDASVTDESTNLLTLARRLHDEHVREGAERRDQLVSDAQAEADRILSEAEQAHRERMVVLQSESAALEAKVEELRVFEREYRSKLKGFIEGQLRDLVASGPEQSAPVAPAFNGFGG
ncbi:MAG TPA: DivIVA domain-containing protein [Candidatus Lumbricidophila sp.]|nr:DivIVA domain-containing protein [Candidatus Lumbricidophila sp.]